MITAIANFISSLFALFKAYEPTVTKALDDAADSIAKKAEEYNRGNN